MYLETEFGYTILSTNNDGNFGFSIGSDISPPQPVDTVGYGVSAGPDEFIYVAGSPFHGGVFFSWASTEPGQVREIDQETQSVDSFAPVHLRPNSWTLLVSIEGSTLKGHITRFGFPKSQQNEFFDVAPAGWTASGGAWVAENGFYRNVANVAFTSTVYRGLELTGEYDLHTGMFSQWRAPGNTLGLLLHYRDNANFDEIRFNASGAITYTRVTRGARKVLRTAQYPVEVPGAFGAFVARRGNQLDFWAGARCSSAWIWERCVAGTPGSFQVGIKPASLNSDCSSSTHGRSVALNLGHPLPVGLPLQASGRQSTATSTARPTLPLRSPPANPSQPANTPLTRPCSSSGRIRAIREA